MAIPHPDSETFSVKCAVITVSDTRAKETDRSGQLIQQSLKDVGHKVISSSYQTIENLICYLLTVKG